MDSLPSPATESEPITVEDSGDEGGDLSEIMLVKIKDDPYDFTDAADLTTELREYTESTMEVLQAALGDISEDEEMEPPLPSCEAYPLAEKVEEKQDVPGHSPFKSASEAVEVKSLPTDSETYPSKSLTSFQKTSDPLSIQEVEDRLKYLKYFARKQRQRFVLFCFSGSLYIYLKFLQTSPASLPFSILIALRQLLASKTCATDQAETLGFEATQVADELSKQDNVSSGAGVEAVKQVETVEIDDTDPLKRSLAHEFSSAAQEAEGKGSNQFLFFTNSRWIIEHHYWVSDWYLIHAIINCLN